MHNQWNNWTQSSTSGTGSSQGVAGANDRNEWGSNQQPPNYPWRHRIDSGSTARVGPIGHFRGTMGVIPRNFHEYHWRSSAGSGFGSSRTSTAGSSVGGEADLIDANAYGERSWEHTNLGSLVHSSKKVDSTAYGGRGVRFTLMSYNILAPGLLEKHPELYTNCNPGCLEWENRLMLLLEQIEKFKVDVLCMQEVEALQFENTFEPRLNAAGYNGVFKKKTGEKDDGCAIFYRASKFLLLDKLEIEFLQPHVPLLNRDNVGLLVKLETRNTIKRQKFIVGTTHLLFNPKRQDVKVAQAQVLLAELDRFAFCGFNKDGSCLYHPILMGGDFNCNPYSSVLNLFTDGQLQYVDEHGDLIKSLKSVLPPHLGITDQCQHYKVVLERYRRWKTSHKNYFELDVKTQENLVNLFPYVDIRPDDELNHVSPPKDLVSLLSPVTENLEITPSIMDTAETQLLVEAAQKIEALASMPAASSSRDNFYPFVKISDEPDSHILTELDKHGLLCTFGSGKLTHNFHFRDIHISKLDRKETDNAVTTRQFGWACVDYVFQSMTWNDSFNKRVEGNLKLIRRLGLPSRAQCKKLGPIPNQENPSDHFPIIAEFLIR